MSLSVRIDWQYILSRVGVSVRPRILYTRKTSKTIANTASHTRMFISMKHRPAIHGQRNMRKEGVCSSWLGAHRPITATILMVTAVGRWVCARSRVCACVRVGMCTSVRVRARTCVHACVRDVFVIYDNIIWPRLIMIIIKTIILYFIQITHTDDFLSTGTRLVQINIRAGDSVFEIYVGVFRV